VGFRLKGGVGVIEKVRGEDPPMIAEGFVRPLAVPVEVRKVFISSQLMRILKIIEEEAQKGEWIDVGVVEAKFRVGPLRDIPKPAFLGFLRELERGGDIEIREDNGRTLIRRAF
jgi:hypothetical protein